MALFPKRVDIDKASIAVLVAMYQDAADYVKSTIFEVGKRQVTVTSVRAAQALIAGRLYQLGQMIGPWSQDQVSNLYNQGQNDAVEELRSFHDPRTDAIAATILAGSAAITQLHQDAVDSLTNELASHLGQAVDSMQRSSTKTLNQVLHQSIQLRVNDLEGMPSARKVKSAVIDAFNDNGVYALMDAAGKRWEPSVYAEMVANTISAKTRNSAMSYSLSTQGYDLVQVSSHGAEDACGQWEGAILSLNGDTPGYFTVDDATGAGLFHVHCTHSLDPVDIADYPDKYAPADPTQEESAAIDAE